MSTSAYGSAATRRRILQATWQLLEAGGTSARLADVAERAGVSRQAVYLHFGDRSSLLLALVAFMDETLGVDARAQEVFDAATGVEVLERAIALDAWLAPRIDPVARVFESRQYEDSDLRAAWRDRMDRRRDMHARVVQRLAAEGRLAEGWTLSAAADLLHAVLMPGVWRELAGECAWSLDAYSTALTRLLVRALVTNPPADSHSGAERQD